MSSKPRRIAMIDTETTGLSSEDDRIVDLGVVIGRAGVIEERHQWLINPGRPIPPEATAVHGITDEMVQGEPSFAQVADEFLFAVDGCFLAAYNARFDRPMVMAELERCGKGDSLTGEEWLDPLIWSREFYKYKRGKKLEDMAARLGMPLNNAHRALADAEAAMLVMFELVQRHEVPKSFKKLIEWQTRLAHEQDADYAAYRKRQEAERGA